MMYSVLLVLALVAQGYARPNCFFTCDYPMGQIQPPVQPSYPSPNGNIVQPYNPSLVDVFRPGQAQQLSYAQPAHVENFQPSPLSGNMNFNHESQANQKTSISGTYTYAVPSPPISEPFRYQPVQYQPVQYQPIQKPCRTYSDCS